MHSLADIAADKGERSMRINKNTAKTILTMRDSLEMDMSGDTTYGHWYVIVKKIPVGLFNGIDDPQETFSDEQILKTIEAMNKSKKNNYPLNATHSLCMIKVNENKESLLDAVKRMYFEQILVMEKKAKKEGITIGTHSYYTKLYFGLYVDPEDSPKAEKCLHGMQFDLWIPNVRTLRNITGLTQAEFGNRYMVPKRSIQNWESGDREPPKYVRYLLMTNVLADVAKNCFTEEETF